MRDIYCHTKSIRVLDPVLAVRCIYCSRIAVDVIEAHIGSVHDVNAPQLGILDVEILDTDIGDIPKNQRHWSTGLGIALLGRIPCISVAINATSTMSIDGDVLACYNESSGMVLEGDGV
jgi:hypothetical protein